MANEIHLIVNAAPHLAFDELDPDDRNFVSGVHVVYVDAAMPAQCRADAALDVFHSCVAVSELEDFEFSVVDPETGRVLEQLPEHDGYSMQSDGEYGYCDSRQPLEIAAVRVLSVGVKQESQEVGTVVVAGSDWVQLQARALQILWEPRASGGAMPVCQRLDHEAAPARAAPTPAERQR